MNILNETSTEIIQDLGKFFYLVPPKDSTFKDVNDVPYYMSELFPLFLGLVVAEYVALVLKGHPPRLAESLNSLGHGIITEMVKQIMWITSVQFLFLTTPVMWYSVHEIVIETSEETRTRLELFRILTMGLEVSLYISIHNKYRLVNLSWDNPITWYCALLGVDMAYYWAHRASHEINFLWQQHQIHHSSEDFNMAVAVRHPFTHNWINSFFYLPLALVIPPAHCLAHQQLNLLYQGWIHTSLVGSLGPLEYFFNTPTHHKVHHGCNLYVLDKNYGGLLIIWDRLFGTFQSMRKDEELVFGVVYQPESHNPIWQTYYRWPGLWNLAKSQKTWPDFFRTLFYGPSWIPGVGAPRLGRDEDKVDIKPRPKFVVPLSKWLQAYILLHFLAVCLVFQEFAIQKGNFDEVTVAFTVTYLLVTLTSIGLLSEGNPWASYFEFSRCALFLYLLPTETYFLHGALRFYFGPSVVIWGFVLLHRGFHWYKLELKYSRIAAENKSD